MRSLLLLAGILAILWMPADWQRVPVWYLLPPLLPMLWWRALRIALPALLGAACALQAVGQVTRLPPLQPGERVMVEAHIEGVPALDESGWQFDAAIGFPRHPDWPAQRWRVRLPASMQAPAPGESWQYALRFDPPRDAAQRRLLMRDRISAQARLVEGPFNLRISASGGGLDGLRARLARRISDRIADPSAASLLAALAVGVTGEVSTRQWQVFNATGITHLVAISGMHVTFFAMLSMAAARRLWRRLPVRLAPRRELFAAIVGILMALLYALLSGFSVPAQRTVVMLAAFLVVRECSRCATPAFSVAAAVWAVLLFDPFAALSAGFWLSFLAVGAIVMLAGARLSPGAPLRTAVRVQWLVSLALLPVTVAIFGTFSAVGLLANALAIPVFTLLLVPPVLLATACYLLPGGLTGWGGDLLVDLAARVCTLLWPFLTWCAELPGALWHAQVPLTWYLVAAPAVLLVLLPVQPLQRVAAMLLLLSVFVLREPRPRTGEVWIDVPDASAQVVLLRTRGQLLLWGTGESFGARGRAFSRHVLPLLRAAGHAQLALWLPGSLTRDTQAALALGVAFIDVERTVLPPARSPPPEMQTCGPEQWQQDGLTFLMDASDDGRQCLLRVTAGESELRLGGAGATALVAAPGKTLRLAMDAGGIRQRRSHRL